jgi:hypothetical protein
VISRILCNKEFEEKPPVLIDVGASGNHPMMWKEISRHCICIGFDADKRETDFGVYENDGYKKHYVINKIVADSSGEKKFYLTKSPYCSSTLPPDTSALQPWYFAGLFEVQKIITLNSTDLLSVLASINIDYVDWFKTDSQGTDLRIFNSLGIDIIQNIIIAEFEPGMMDAYIGEDKLYTLMRYMEKLPFWITDMAVKGTQRVGQNIVNDNLAEFQKRYLFLLQKKAPYWVEISYFNSFRNIETYSKRSILLGCALALVKNQYGFAYELAQKSESRFKDQLFLDIKSYALQRIKNNTWRIPLYVFKTALEMITKRILKI